MLLFKFEMYEIFIYACSRTHADDLINCAHIWHLINSYTFHLIC